jgi:hypothetical protein
MLAIYDDRKAKAITQDVMACAFFAPTARGLRMRHGQLVIAGQMQAERDGAATRGDEFGMPRGCLGVQ